MVIDRRKRNSRRAPIDRRMSVGDRRQEIKEALPVSLTSGLVAFERLRQVLQQTKQELRRVQERYQQLYELSPLSYITLDTNGLIVDINPSASKLMGIQREQFHQTPFVDFLHKQDVVRWNALLSTLRQDEVKQHMLALLPSAAGSLFEARLDCMRQTMYPEAETILISITDIAASKQVEEQFGFAAVTFDIEEGIIVTNPQMVILQVNPAFTRITGFSNEEVIGRTPQLLHSGMQESDFYQCMWRSVNDMGYWQGEIWNLRKNGETFPEYLTISAIKDATGQVAYYVGSFLDISLHKQVETKALESHYQIQQRLQEKNAEFRQIKSELCDINTALKILVQQQGSGKSDTKAVLEQEINQEIIPLLYQLKKGNHDAKQLALLQILDANLQNLITSYGRSHSIARVFQELTPKEIQVASMIRQGFSTKSIATTLSASTETINVHRKNIRKKLGLDNKAINLRSYLASFD